MKLLGFWNRSQRKKLLVASKWPGYFLATRANTIPGLENHFGPRAAHRLKVLYPKDHKELSELYKIRTEKMIMWDIKLGQIPYVLLRTHALKKRYRRILDEGGYQKIAAVESLRLYSKVSDSEKMSVD